MSLIIKFICLLSTIGIAYAAGGGTKSGGGGGKSEIERSIFPSNPEPVYEQEESNNTISHAATSSSSNHYKAYAGRTSLPSTGLGPLPDLQFGLALTIPFISFTTDKLVNSLTNSHGRGLRSWSDVASFLKLNITGLLLAGIVGVGALVFILPTLLQGKGILKGFGSNLFDNLIMNGGGLGFGSGGLNKHFGYGQYENYDESKLYGHQNYGWNSGTGAGGSGYLRKGTRQTDQHASNSTLWSTISNNWSEIENCGLYAMCLRGKQQLGTGIGTLSELNPYIKQLEEAYKIGSENMTASCADQFTECNKIPKFINSIGDYLFT